LVACLLATPAKLATANSFFPFADFTSSDSQRSDDTPGGQAAAPAPVRAGGNIPFPQKIRDVKPVYPAEAQRARVSGIVILEATIAEDGHVRDAVVKRSIPLLDQAALDAVRQWMFTPTVVNGQPVPVIMAVTVNFSIDGAQTSTATEPFPSPPALGVIRLTAMRNQDGSTHAFEIPNARAAGLPHWSPDVEMPPISVVEATRIGRAWLAGRNPSVQRFELQSVTLSRIRRTTQIDFWFYQLNFFSNQATQPGPLLAVVLPDGSPVEPTDSGADAAAGASRVDQPAAPVTTPPRALRQVQPAYTAEARQRKISGAVLVEGTVGADGVFRDLRVTRSLDPMYGLDDEALKAAAQWQFAPGVRNGQPVPMTITIELDFTVR
jgi:protein TonB